MTDTLALLEAGRTPTYCRGCGKVDIDPKQHIGLFSYHHDCVADEDMKMTLMGNHSEHPLVVASVYKAARESGKRGMELLNLILTLERPADHGDATMMAKATTYANDILDAGYQSGASGTYVLGATTYTLPLKCRFQTTLSTAGAQGTEFTASGGYSAGGVSLSGLFTVAASAASKANTGAVTVTNSPAGTWAGNEITDSTGTPKRMNFGPASSLAKTVNSGDTCTIPIGSLTGTET